MVDPRDARQNQAPDKGAASSGRASTATGDNRAEEVNRGAQQAGQVSSQPEPPRAAQQPAPPQPNGDYSHGHPGVPPKEGGRR